MCCHFLLQGIFLTQEPNPHLLHRRWILYHWTTWEAQMLIYHYEKPRGLKNCAKSTQSVLYKWNNKARMTAHLFTAWFTEYFKPTLEIYCSGKKVSFENITLINSAPGHPKALVVNVVPANEIAPMDQGVISIFKSYSLRNRFCKTIGASGSDSSGGYERSKFRTSWKGFTF